jgi:hypothetical protein
MSRKLPGLHSYEGGEISFSSLGFCTLQVAEHFSYLNKEKVQNGQCVKFSPFINGSRIRNGKFQGNPGVL